MPTSVDWMKRWYAVVQRLTIMHSDQEIERFLDRLCLQPGPKSVAFVNAHVFNIVANIEQHEKHLLNTDHVFIDGIGMACLLRMLGRNPGLNLNGTDFIPRLLGRAKDQKVALLGTQSPYLEMAAEEISQQLGIDRFDIVTDHGFHDDHHYLEMLEREHPAFIILGMGVPKQERIANLLQKHLRHPCIIVSGGAILDFFSGRMSRAPGWLRSLRMEWAYRLCLEPRRLFSRYVIGNPMFILRSLGFEHYVHRHLERLISKSKLAELMQTDASAEPAWDAEDSSPIQNN